MLEPLVLPLGEVQLQPGQGTHGVFVQIADPIVGLFLIRSRKEAGKY